MEDSENKVGKRKRQQNDEVGAQRMKMLKVRAALEEKLKQKGVFSSITWETDKPHKLLKPLNAKLESYDDFDDDAVNAEGAIRGVTNGRASKLSQLVAANPNTSKMEDSETGDSEDEFYKQVKEKRDAKLAAKAKIYSRSSAVPSLVETETVDGKRYITYQMEKNRGLTRARKKLIKNPRNNKLKHKKATKRRKGQHREVKKPVGPYGGEASGINAGISRGIRFKN